MMALVKAWLTGDFKIFLLYLEKCENIQCVDHGGNSLLHSSISITDLMQINIDDHIHLIETLVQRGLDIDLKNKRGETPLHLALQGYCPSCLRCLPIIKCLVDNRCDVNIKNNMNQSPLDIACRSAENFYVVKLLIDHGADVKKVSCKTIKTIANNFDSLTLTLLFDSGLEFTSAELSHSSECSKDKMCLVYTLLSALKNGYIRIVRLLIHMGVDVTSELSGGYYLIHEVVCEGDIELIKLLLNKGANVNAVNYKLETPLHKVTLLDNLDAFKLLLERGGDPFHCNIEGKSLMSYAIRRGNVEIVKLLSKLGVPFEKVEAYSADFGWSCDLSPLSMAAYYRHLPLFEFLIQKGFNVNEKESNGLSVIHLATMGRCLEIVQRILYLGVDVNLRSDNGETPLSIAFSCFYCDLCYLFINNYNANLNGRTKEGDNVLESAIVKILDTPVDDIYQGLYECYFIIDEALRLKAAELDYSDDKIKSSDILSYLLPPKMMNSKYYLKCKNEIKSMKKVPINENLSLYNFLCSDVNRCVRIIRSDATERLLVGLKPFTDFPYFYSKLCFKLNRAVRLKHLNKIAVEFFESVDIEPYLSSHCIDIIVSYLDIPSLMTIEVTLTGTNAIFKETVPPRRLFYVRECEESYSLDYIDTRVYSDFK